MQQLVPDDQQDRIEITSISFRDPLLWGLVLQLGHAQRRSDVVL